MKILVTGANGQLGMSLRRLATGSALEFVFTDVADGPDTARLDITDLAAVRSMVAAEGADAIVNCAAYTNVDAAEDNPELAELLNATAVGNLARVMQETGGLLVHISTDYVFGGECFNTPASEEREGAPTGVYGLTKLHGEQAVLASGARYVILRTAWLYSEFGKNFVKTMLRLTGERPQLKVVFDQVGTPTYAGDLAEAIVEILHFVQNDRMGVQNDFFCHPERSEGSIFNFTDEGVCSWYDFAVRIQEEVRRRSLPVSDSERPAVPLEGVKGVDLSQASACEVLPCHSSEFPSKVVRPAYSVLDKTKIKETFGLRIPHWTESLSKCIDNLIK